MRCVTSVSMWRRSKTICGHYVAPRTKGYQTEFSFGYPVVLTSGAWRALVGYRYLQRRRGDRRLHGFRFPLFRWHNARGYYVVVDYGLSNRLRMRLRYLSANEIDGPIFDVDTLQIDMNASF